VPVVLDERGVQATTRELAGWLSGWMAEGVSPAFIIGGADGLDDSVKARASKQLGLSRLTLPHALARVMLAEQLYRSACIIKGHPYHRD
jgi:23S rRNA (pseudouridine1915-N3)-methyltransferase